MEKLMLCLTPNQNYRIQLVQGHCVGQGQMSMSKSISHCFYHLSSNIAHICAKGVRDRFIPNLGLRQLLSLIFIT